MCFLRELAVFKMKSCTRILVIHSFILPGEWGVHSNGAARAVFIPTPTAEAVRWHKVYSSEMQSLSGVAL